MPNSVLTFTKNNFLTLILITISLINSYGLYKINSPKSDSNSKVANDQTPATTPALVSPDLNAIRQEIAQLKAQQSQLEAIYGTSTSSTGISSVLPESLKLLTISDAKFATVEVYEQPVASSKVISYLDWGKTYSFTSQQGNWYQVALPDGSYGWVSSQLVKQL